MTAGPDRRDQEALYRQARDWMAELLPGWSDRIPSDPAVAVLELAARLSAAQDRRLEQVREEHWLAYLKLLGERPAQLTPARLLARPVRREGLCEGMRFFIDGVPFEAADGWRHGDNGVESAVLLQDGRETALAEDAPLRLAAGRGAELRLTFRGPLAAGVPARLWFGLLPEPGRVPPDGDTPPPAALAALAGGEGGWTPADCRDGTCGLLRSGSVTVTPPREADALLISVRGEIEGEPRISAVVWEPVLLEQRRTRSRCLELAPPFLLPPGCAGNWALRFFLRQGAGWRQDEALFIRDGCVAGWKDCPPAIRVVAAEPDFSALHPLRELAGEEVCLEEDGVLPQSLRAMVEEDGLWYDCPVGGPEGASTLPRGCRWDGARRALRFGDGRDFRVPRAGRLLVAGCARTLGRGGNGAGGPLAQGGVSLLPLGPASGGQDGEDARTAFLRAARAQRALLRAVTPEDYEALALQTPGLALEAVRAVPGRTAGMAGIALLARPRGGGGLTRWQRERLLDWMERFRLLGVPVAVEDWPAKGKGGMTCGEAAPIPLPHGSGPMRPVWG